MDEQGLIVVKDNFLSKIVRFLRNIFTRKNICVEELQEVAKESQIEIEYINEDLEFVQEEILRARSAFRKYVINNNKNISLDILNYIEEKLAENEDKIRKIIEINEDNITFEEIQTLLQNAKKDINQFKLQNKKTLCYQVPLGVIGVFCSNTKDCINNMFKSITTRNSIMILDKNYSKYNTSSLILLIIKECLRNFYVDDDIIQMFEKEELDLTKLDKIIDTNSQDDNNVDEQEYDETIYIYQEDNCFESDVKNEIDKLQSINDYKNYELKVIKGEFGDIINFINTSKPFAVCMYTNNAQKAYKFINWSNSQNVFVNTGIVNCKGIAKSKNEYFNLKYVLHEDVFEEV